MLLLAALHMYRVARITPLLCTRTVLCPHGVRIMMGRLVTQPASIECCLCRCPWLARPLLCVQGRIVHALCLLQLALAAGVLMSTTSLGMVQQQLYTRLLHQTRSQACYKCPLVSILRACSRVLVVCCAGVETVTVNVETGSQLLYWLLQ